MPLHRGVQVCSTIVKRCPMSDDACAAKVIEQIAAHYTPDMDVKAIVEQACGRFTRGKSAGKLRGWASIKICTEGGWKRYGPGEGNGRVVYPGTVLGVAITDFNGKPYIAVGETI